MTRGMRNFINIMLVMALLAILAAPAFGASIGVSWIANTESDLAGYNVYYAAPGDPGWIQEAGQWTYTGTMLTHKIASGLTPSARIDNCAPGPFIIGITAYDTSANESGLSATVGALVPEMPEVIIMPTIDLPPGKPVTIQIQINR